VSSKFTCVFEFVLYVQKSSSFSVFHCPEEAGLSSVLCPFARGGSRCCGRGAAALALAARLALGLDCLRLTFCLRARLRLTFCLRARLRLTFCLRARLRL